MRRKKLDVEIKSARDAITENQKLKQEIDVSKKKCPSHAILHLFMFMPAGAKG